MDKTVRFIILSGAVAALYVVLVVVFAPISFGSVQVRVAEALSVLAVFTPAAVPGLFIGCLIANITGGAVLLDVLLGSLATLAAAVCTYIMRKNVLAALAPPVLINALVIGAVLTYVYKVGMAYLFTALYVGAGQAISCYAVGYPLYRALQKHRTVLFGEER